jgi:5-methylcytosine-specific restriction endonuclease McrA
MDKRYPPTWPDTAYTVKTRAGWRCQACQAPHGPPPHVLTVDHFDYDKQNSNPANLLALCQRCHLRRQGLNPPAKTPAEALRRLAARHQAESTQRPLVRETESPLLLRRVE